MQLEAAEREKMPPISVYEVPIVAGSRSPSPASASPSV